MAALDEDPMAVLEALPEGTSVDADAAISAVSAVKDVEDSIKPADFVPIGKFRQMVVEPRPEVAYTLCLQYSPIPN
jgi:hypothetical protein